MDTRVTVFFNTGFSMAGDIPASPTVLNGATSKTYPGVYYIREDVDKPSIKIADTYESLCDVDYCRIDRLESGLSTRSCYYFASPRALNQGVTVLELSLDALLTMGGAATLTYSSGWQTRGHIPKTEDTLFSNTTAEDWSPSDPLRCVSMTDITTDTEEAAGESISVLMSATDLVAAGSGDGISVVTGEDADGAAVMYFPQVKANSYADSTFFSVWDDTEPTGTPGVVGAPLAFRTPGTCAFDARSTAIVEALTKLYSAGQLQLQSSYTIPGRYYDPDLTVVDDSGRYSRIAGSYDVVELTAHPYEYTIPDGDGTYTPKNKKVFTTYRSYVIVNLGSGDMSSKAPYEIYDRESESQYPSVKVWSDPTSTGKPYARFAYLLDNPLQWSDTVKGLQWANSQLLLEGASGSMWNSLSASFQSQSIARQQQSLRDELYYSTAQYRYNRAAAGELVGLQAEQISDQYARTGLNTIAGSVSTGLGAILSTLGTPMSSIESRGVGVGLGVAGMQAGSIIPTTLNATARMDDMQRQAELLGLQHRNAIQNMDYSQWAAERSNALEQAALAQRANETGATLAQNNYRAPSVLYTPEQNLGLYGYNRFIVYEIRKSDSDLKSEDQYYQRYGYSGLHRPLTRECFDQRQYYTYVQAYDVNIKSTWGMRVRQKAIAQLNGGVRVWKVLPDPQYYDLN